MVRAAYRAALFVSVMLAVWAVARPASAAPAPLCDDRGATVVALPPALEAPDIAIERARLSNTCPFSWGVDLPLGAGISTYHATAELCASTAEPGLPVEPLALSPPRGEELGTALALPRVERGVRFRVERPPRG
jgi:hypothetical protein